MKPETRNLLNIYTAAMREAIAILEEEDIAAQDSPAERAYCVLVKALEGK